MLVWVNLLRRFKIIGNVMYIMHSINAVCMALQAIARCTGPDLVSAFLPQVISLLRHDRDLVKKKALLALHRLLQLDRECSSDIQKHLVEKLGHKEPSVMVAALCGLHDLASRDPIPYRNLVHYFTNILKQASEGKLGKAWDYHRAPAPFVQVKLLRLLSILGAGDVASSRDMSAVLIEVWRRAEALPSASGNALVYECMRTATTIHPSEDLLSMAIEGVSRFLKAKENNLKYAGIDILSRLVGGDPGRVQQYQVPIIECLHSSDVTLKRKTLDLLFKMTGPANFEVVAQEALQYVKDPTDDDAPRCSAANQLLEIAETFAPSMEWYADTVLSLLEASGEVISPVVTEKFLQALSEEIGRNSGQKDLQQHLAIRCCSILDQPKLPAHLLVVACWILGEYGTHSGKSLEALAEKLTMIAETHISSPLIVLTVVMACGKLSSCSGISLPLETLNLIENLSKSPSLEIAQISMEMKALHNASKKGNLEQSHLHPLCRKTSTTIGNVGSLDIFVQNAKEKGALPYLDVEERRKLGFRSLNWKQKSGEPTMVLPLKFQSYVPYQATSGDDRIKEHHEEPFVNNIFDGLELGDASYSIEKKAASSPKSGNVVMMPEDKLVINRATRRWGPNHASALADSHGQDSGRGKSKTIDTTDTADSDVGNCEAYDLDPSKRNLVASLFGDSWFSAQRSAQSKCGVKNSSVVNEEPEDLLDINTDDICGSQSPSVGQMNDLLGGMFENTIQNDSFPRSFDDSLNSVQQTSPIPTSERITVQFSDQHQAPRKSGDPFANLLD